MTTTTTKGDTTMTTPRCHTEAIEHGFTGCDGQHSSFAVAVAGHRIARKAGLTVTNGWAVECQHTTARGTICCACNHSFNKEAS